MKHFNFKIIAIIFILVLSYSNINIQAKSAKIEELKLNLIIPEGFYPIYKSSDSIEISDLGLNPDSINQRMAQFDSYLMLYNFTSEVHFSKTENAFANQIYSLFDANQEVINGLTEGYSKGFGNADIYETNNMRFLVFNYSLKTVDGELFYLKYKTIVNGIELTINYINPNSFTLNDKFQMKRIIDSLKFDDDIQPNGVINDFSFIIGLLLVTLVLMIYFAKKYSKIIKEFLTGFALMFGSIIMVVFLIFTIIWHAYGSWILYQMYGYMWAIISFFFPVVSEVIIITLYISKKGFTNLYILGWVIIFSTYIMFYLFSKMLDYKTQIKSSIEIKELHIKCRNCETLNLESTNYCKNCGERLTKSIFKYLEIVPSVDKFNKICTNCNNKCLSESSYCTNCGSKFI